MKRSVSQASLKSWIQSKRRPEENISSKLRLLSDYFAIINYATLVLGGCYTLTDREYIIVTTVSLCFFLFFVIIMCS